MQRILIIEDEESISDLIKLNLEVAGYSTLQVYDGEQGLEYINKEEIALALLDIMLPKLDGYQIIPHLVKRGIPVVFLTAKTSLKDRVYGLNLGADDYIIKPFEGIELIARVKAVLRRTGKESSIRSFDDIKLYLDSRKVFKSDFEIELTAKEFDLLELLVENRGIALSRDRLLEKAWGYEYYGNTRTVDMHIQKLRSKLGTEKIKTVFKIGYRLED